MVRLQAWAHRCGPGALLVGTIALAASFVADHLGGQVMLYALLFGIAFHFLSADDRFSYGVNFCAQTILRVGVALLGLRITMGDVASLGLSTVVLVVGGVAFTLLSGWAIGRIWGLRPDQAILSAGAVAICGASAALAISAVLPQHKNSERNTIMTVVGVTALSTIAMVLYPILVQSLGMDHRAAGIYIGATIHDVAQVVGAGYIISDETGEVAALVKLMRVTCLVPVVMVISLTFREGGQKGPGATSAHLLPPFLIAFVLLIGINSTGVVPASVAAMGGDVSRWGLVLAVSALGVKTSLQDIFKTGPGPLAVLCLQTISLAIFVLAGLWAIGLAG